MSKRGAHPETELARQIRLAAPGHCGSINACNDRAGLSKNTLDHYVNGQVKDTSMSNLMEIARHYGWSRDTVLDWAGYIWY